MEQSHHSIEVPSIPALDAKSVCLSVVNFFLWNGIKIEASLVASVASKVLTVENLTCTSAEIIELTKKLMDSLDSAATVLNSLM